MKNIILIFGILTTVIVYGVVAGPSDNAAPVIDMELNETQCRDCHGDDVKKEHHSLPWGKDKCCECHDSDHCSSGKNIEMTYMCGFDGVCHNSSESVTDHHNFSAIFGDDDWDCLICHEQRVPRPLDR